jgi:glycosyltransferase involved in cell wall biosynthesis
MLYANIYLYFLYFIARIRKILRTKNFDVIFVCGFHGESGGSQAIANIANILSLKINVGFVSYGTSPYNHLLDKSVTILTDYNYDTKTFITDLSINIEDLLAIKRRRKRILTSIHGFKNKAHQLSEKHVESVLKLTDAVHFVSDYQASSFSLQPSVYKVIPNTAKRIYKSKQTNNIGSVGNLNNVEKRAEETIEIGMLSKAEKIHLWFREPIVDSDSGKVIYHPKELNKSKIYNSFDVLVFMSEMETFGLVIIEAMSAGIPCVLPPLEVFQQFSSCPGVRILHSRDSNEASEIVNELLDNKLLYRDEIISFFESHYSEEAVVNQWLEYLSEVQNKPEKAL